MWLERTILPFGNVIDSGTSATILFNNSAVDNVKLLNAREFSMAQFCRYSLVNDTSCRMVTAHIQILNDPPADFCQINEWN